MTDSPQTEKKQGKKRSTKPIFYPTLFMIVLTLIFGGAIELLNAATKDTIAAQESLRVKENVLYVFAIPLENGDIEATYDKYVSERTIGDYLVYVGTKNEVVIGYAFQVDGPALWGGMIGYAALSSDLTTILGMSVVSHAETPGLGGRIDEAWFKDQFRGLPINPPLVFKPKAGGNIDAITGATLTSEAVRVMLKDDIAEFIERVGGDLGGQ